MTEKLGILVDTAIRSATILSRILFNFVALVKLSSEDFGIFIYIQSIIAICQYVAPLDFSLVGHRKLLQKKISIASYLRTNIPILLFGFSFSQILIFSMMWGKPLSLILVVSVILVMEVITSESQRLLVVMGKFTTANILSALKTTAWMICLIFYWNNNDGTILNVIIFWLIGLFFCTIFFILKMYFFKIDWSDFRLSKRLIKEFIRVGPIVILGTLSTRILFSMDRIIVESFSGYSLVGIYGFYVGVASAYLAVLDAIFLTRLFPYVVKLFNDANYFLLDKSLLKFIIICLLLGVIGEVGYFLLIDKILIMINKENLIINSNIGYWLIASYVTYAASFGFHYTLYAAHNDKQITFTSLVSLTPFLTMFYMEKIDLIDVAIVLFLSMATNFFAKLFLYLNLPQIKKYRFA